MAEALLRSRSYGECGANENPGAVRKGAERSWPVISTGAGLWLVFISALPSSAAPL